MQTSTGRGSCSACGKRQAKSKTTDRTRIVLGNGRILQLKKGDVFTVPEKDTCLIEKMNSYGKNPAFTLLEDA